MDVVDKIAAVPTASRGQHDDVPQMAVVIRKAREVEAAAPAAAPQPAEPRSRSYSSENAFSSSSALVGSSFRTAASPLRRA